MYLGIQNGKIALVAETETELANNKFMVFDEIRFTEDEYVMYNGEYLVKAEAEQRQAEDEKQRQIKELQEQLEALDVKAIRALRAIQAGTGTETDTAKLAELEEQAVEIRRQIQEIINPTK